MISLLCCVLHIFTVTNVLRACIVYFISLQVLNDSEGRAYVMSVQNVSYPIHITYNVVLVKVSHIRCLVSGCRNDIYDQRDWICSLCINSVFPFNHDDDDVDFMSVISENWTVQMTPTLQELNDMVLPPFEFNDDELTNHPLFNIDSDYQYFNISNGTYANFNYFLEDSFFNKVSHLPLENSYFSIMHLNMRSIPRHMNEFT